MPFSATGGSDCVWCDLLQVEEEEATEVRGISATCGFTKSPDILLTLVFLALIK